MSIMEGSGVFSCGNCDPEFKTEDVEEWNRHCLKNPDKHVEYGTAPCIVCRAVVSIDNLPYTLMQPNRSKNYIVFCEEHKPQT